MQLSNPPSFHTVSFGGKDYKTVEFDVSEGWVSFHHALHWLLAELCKHVRLLTEENLRSVGVQGGLKGVFWRVNEQDILNVIDFPLRGMRYQFLSLSNIFDALVLAMIAQIRTGLWVRNGFAIRDGQLLHYRDYMLHELCYDQDI